MRRFLTLICVLAFIALARADTPVQGTPVQGTIATTTWTKAKSPYRVQDTVFVPASETLTIDAGVDVLFDADVPFAVAGSVRAQGTPSDSVRFLAGVANHWDGIWIIGAVGSFEDFVANTDKYHLWDGGNITGGDSSAFAYTRISDGLADGPFHYAGGGVWVQGAGVRVSFANSVLTGNGAGQYGGAVASDAARLYFRDCSVIANRSGGSGGGIEAWSGRTVLTNTSISGNFANTAGAIAGVVEATDCLIADNSTWGREPSDAALVGGGTFTDCRFRGNKSSLPTDGGGVISIKRWVHVRGGVFIDDRPILQTTFTRCHFIDNESWRTTVLIMGDSLCQVTFTSCTITGNRTSWGGGATVMEISEPGIDYTSFPETRRRAVLTLEKTVIAGNIGSSGTVLQNNGRGHVTYFNCTITGNRRYWAHPGGLDTTGGIAIGGQAIVLNSVIWDNGGREYFGPYTSVTYSDIMGGWEGEGNIVGDPLFVNPQDGDYRLQAGSPAIGAGTVLPGHPVPVTPPDMGAIAFEYPTGQIPTDAEEPSERPATAALFQNAPNPFNASTTIRFALPNAAPSSLLVHNVHGQAIRTLVSGDMQPGVYTVSWDGLDASGRPVASGVYLVRMTTPTHTATRRMTLLR